jgi:F-type H+-transporting ATPase subunit a
VTATLAIVSFLVWNFSGIYANGITAWAHHFMGGAPWYMAPIIVPVEIMGMFVKPCALAIRLFANMNAGHILVAVLISFVGMAYAGLGVGGAVGIGIPVIFGTVAIMCLELFVALLQAYIFTFLTALFIAQLVVHEHEHHEGEGGQHDEAHEALGSGDLTDFAELPEGARQMGTHMAG